MFDAAKVGRRVDADSFERAIEVLRPRLLDAQARLAEAGRPLVVVIAGMEGAGKDRVANRFNEWLDPRGVEVHAFWDEPDAERWYPPSWRFWRALPSAGRTAVLFGGWYLKPIEERLAERIDDAGLEQGLRRIREFERMLIEDGTVIVKLWFHLSEARQRKRLKKRARAPSGRWTFLPVNEAERREHYRRYEHVADRLIRRTDIGRSPWHVIEADQGRYRDLTAGRTLLEALEHALSVPATTASPDSNATPADPPSDPAARVTLLDRLDLSPTLEQSAYREQRRALAGRLHDLAWAAYEQRRPTVVLFEGVDAAGKGGAIRRVTQALDARLYRTVAIGAPTDEEAAHHYLWRFWRQLPRAGYMTLFDRSWYGRVLVERVEGLAAPHRWQRAYMEINEFEEELADSGAIIVKFWLQISRAEQLARFESRRHTPYKRYKITAEDWRNRSLWDTYRGAVDTMLEHTDTERVPWHLVAGDDKRHARIAVMRTITETMEAALDRP